MLFWKDGASLRLYFAVRLALYAAILLLTLGYFIPRDLILFTWPISEHLDEIRTAASQWSHLASYLVWTCRRPVLVQSP
jgi:hypothetical protein